MSGAAFPVDISSVRLVVDHICLRAQGVKDTFRNGESAAVGAVQAHFHIFKRMGRYGHQIADITVPPRRKIHRAADICPRSQGDLGVFPIYILLDLFLHSRLDLLPHAIDDLDPVVIEWIVAGRDHDPAVKVLRAHHIRDTGRGGHMEQKRIRPGSRDPRRQRVLEHIAAPPGVLSDGDLRLFAFAVVPSQETSHTECMFGSQDHIRLPAETVRTKIFSHRTAPFLQ